MAVEYPFGFIVGNTDPIDSRFVFPTIAARDALSQYNRYVGLQTYVVEDQTFYYLKDGITNDDWTPVGDPNAVVGPASSTDNALARFDGATGKAVQNSVATLSDAGALSGLTGLTVTGQSNFYGETNQLGPLNLTSTVSNSQSGTAITIALTSSNNIRLEGNVVSIAGYVAFDSGRITYITNNTPDSITILNESGSAASPSNRIITGTESDIKLGKGATLQLIYDAVAQRHKVVGVVDNKGSKSLDTLLQLTADDSISDWTIFPSGVFSISKVDPIQGDASYVLEMDNLNAATHKGIPVDEKFRGRTIYFKISYEMLAGAGRFNFLDQDNDLISGARFDLSITNRDEFFTGSFDIPSDCTLIRFQAEARDTVVGGYLKFDNVELTLERAVTIPVPERYVVRTYQSGTDWYEVYSDGWVRQGKYVIGAGSFATTTVTWLIPMRDTNYSLVSGLNGDSTSSGVAIRGFGWVSKTTTNAVMYVASNVGKTNVIEGYGDSAAVISHGATPNY